ncbi:MAG TPA: twin-arginine translocase subunit TatB [Gammaproteobacteria bacterium]|nr:twin-arginine translocase subunit TatB [Gammaproteobacteria bacterium]
MFDIGFWELALIMVVALMVIGPERLPGLARTAGLWFGKAQAMIRSVKMDIDRELDAGNKDSGLVPEINKIAEETRYNFHLDASGQILPPEPAADKAEQTTQRSEA